MDLPGVRTNQVKAPWLALLAALALTATPAPAQAQFQTVEYYHLDAVGNVRAVSDEAGQVIERHDYLPFGEEWCGTAVCSQTTAGQPYRFTGKERDPETGLDYFGARYYGSGIGRFTSIDPVYTWQENLADPQRWNRYTYGRSNPLRYIDPDGRVLDTVADVGFIAWDVFDIGRSIYRGEGTTGSQWLALGGDILGAAVPFATGVGAAIRAGHTIDNAIDAGKGASSIIEAGRRGRQSEARVLGALGEAKNTKKVRGCEGCSIPDYQNATTVGEVKDAARVNNTRQIRIQREAAETSGREHVIHTGARTHVSRNVERSSTRVERRPDLGTR